MVSLDKGKRWGFSNREEDSMHNVRSERERGREK